MRTNRLASLGAFLLFLAPGAAAQTPSGQGPHEVGLRPLLHYTPESSSSFGAVWGRTFYPALAAGLEAPPDPAGAPYPHVAFLHGFTVDTLHYTTLMRQIASWGFVVTGVDTNTGWPDPALVQAFVDDQILLMGFVEADAEQPGDLLEGMIDPGPWGVVGHSMGGGAVFFFADATPRAEAVVSLTPYLGTKFGGTTPELADSASFDRSLMMMCGSIDTLTPTFQHGYPWFQSCVSAKERFFVFVEGMGHLSPVDITPTTEPMPADQQDEVTNLMTTGFLLAVLEGQHEIFDQILGEAAQTQPWTTESGGNVPTFWATTSSTQPGDLAYGVAGQSDTFAAVGLAPVPASVPTAWGTLGLDPALISVLWSGLLDPSSGISQALAPLSAPPGTTFYLQALMLQPSSAGALSQTVAYTVP